MLAFTEQAGDALRLVMEMGPEPRTGVRISGQLPLDEIFLTAPKLQLAAVSEFVADDELVLAPGCVPVFIEPEAANLLTGMVLDASTDAGGPPQFIVRRDEHAMGDFW